MASDICDRDFDAKVARTRDRPLPSGQVTLTEAVIVFIIGLAAAVALTYKILGADVTAIMVPIWGLSTIYPLCKRVIWAPQVVLGLTMAMCVLRPGSRAWICVCVRVQGSQRGHGVAEGGEGEAQVDDSAHHVGHSY